ncbi:NAD-dependent epimerase/dehydratase family protein [Ferruginivarius sediminum]|uniref:NAD-dependent epimerase/dehydratase family protein n=1 Tax=Ferruginivarius sediminum TaxID=2661937 RepID=A0A369T4B1_9PROT|nr:NAD-dependent epimerase/dehydratase family protein [Ferruginivarius sediminum]RDD60181.1 NAD-dependent epimerase/dehydratase family protein [Ferruginivarius sediminum]
MRILILGGDGYLGWPTAMHFAARGHQVMAVDNYLRRQIALETRSEPLVNTPNLQDRTDIFRAVSGHEIDVRIGDLAEYAFVAEIFEEFQPECVVHYAEQPSAPYSMIGRRQAALTLSNNLTTTFNVIWAVIAHAPNCHIIKLGTMGEYGTPNIDIEEGFIDIEHKGRKDRFLFPRAAGSLYHTTKILDTDILYFYTRLYRLRVTDLMQGPVYGLSTSESIMDPRLAPNFHYDDIFGTVVNRFLVQAVAGIPLTVYGRGGQTRGYLNLNDTLQCVELAARNPVDPGELRVLNQLTETFTVLEIAGKIRHAAKEIGLNVTIDNIPNPRREAEEHYYNPVYTGLLELGLKPTYMTNEVVADLLNRTMEHAENICMDRVMPRVSWR